MNQESIAQEALISLGLSLGEAKTFLALSTIDSSEATPLAERAEVPQSKIYQYLNSLESKFQIVQKLEIEGKPNQYYAQPFTAVIEKLRTKLDTNIKIAEQYIETKRNTRDRRSDNEYLRVILGESFVRARIKDFIIGSGGKNFVAVGAESVVDEIRPYFDKIDTKLLTMSDVVSPLPPLFEFLQHTPVRKIMEELKVLILIEDIDLEERTSRSFNIIGYPRDDMKIEPLFMQFLHPVIRSFQVEMMLTMLDAFSSIDPMQIMKQMGGMPR